jgi:hypothetical protein
MSSIEGRVDEVDDASTERTLKLVLTLSRHPDRCRSRHRAERPGHGRQVERGGAPGRNRDDPRPSVTSRAPCAEARSTVTADRRRTAALSSGLEV